MKFIRAVALVFAIFNLVSGLASFAGPLVSCNRDKGINLRPGLLFGRLAVNWVHAAIHVLMGVLGLAAVGTKRYEQAYMRLNAGLFGSLATLGWTSFGMHKGIYMKMGMALNWMDNILHSGLALAAVPFALIRPNPLDAGFELSDGKMEVIEDYGGSVTTVEIS